LSGCSRGRGALPGRDNQLPTPVNWSPLTLTNTICCNLHDAHPNIPPQWRRSSGCKPARRGYMVKCSNQTARPEQLRLIDEPTPFGVAAHALHAQADQLQVTSSLSTPMLCICRCHAATGITVRHQFANLSAHQELCEASVCIDVPYYR
jgi:hypothetical protein